MRYIAYVVKGLEKIAKEEIKLKIEGAKIEKVGDKRIIFGAKLDPYLISSLGTIDDLGLLIASDKKIDSLEKLVSLFFAQDLSGIKNEINKFRRVNDTFSLTVGFAGVKNFKAKDATELISKGIGKKYGWHFTEFDHRNFDVRLFIDHAEAFISIRLAQDPLYNRPYKTEAKIGSLKPTVAAAMVFLATGQKKKLRVVDSFCGSGTILCEAFVEGSEVFGGDIDPEGTNITKQNLANLGYKSEGKIKVLDATRTNWPAGYFDCAVSNFPWNEQVTVKSTTELYTSGLKELTRIVKPTGTLCLLVSKPELLIKYIKKFMPNSLIETTRLGLLGQTPTIVTVKRRSDCTERNGFKN